MKGRPLGIKEQEEITAQFVSGQMTREELASKLGVSVRTIYRYTNPPQPTEQVSEQHTFEVEYVTTEVVEASSILGVLRQIQAQRGLPGVRNVREITRDS